MDVGTGTGDEWILVHRVRLDGGVLSAAEALQEGRRLRDGG